MVTLREWALSQGIHPQTAYRWYRQGKLPVPARKMGKLILVGDLEAQARQKRGRTVIYARVSSADQKSNLDRQVARVVAWATEHGYSVDQVVTDVGSALNGHVARSSRCCGTGPSTPSWSSTVTGAVASGPSTSKLRLQPKGVAWSSSTPRRWTTTSFARPRSCSPRSVAASTANFRPPIEPSVRSRWPAGRPSHDRPDADQGSGRPRGRTHGGVGPLRRPGQAGLPGSRSTTSRLIARPWSRSPCSCGASTTRAPRFPPDGC